MARKKRNPDAEKLAESILNAYQPESVDVMQDALTVLTEIGRMASPLPGQMLCFSIR